jgi:hypothetical protein
MEALEPFETTVTFCFTPQHLGIAPHHTSAPREPEQFADFCAWMIDRYGPKVEPETRSSRVETRGAEPRHALRPRSGRRGIGVVTGGINVAVVGVGNCASSLVQGLAHTRTAAPTSRSG